MGEDGVDAGQGAGRRRVDRDDAGVGVRAAQEGDLEQARQADVVDVAALAGQQARVLLAQDGRPEARLSGRAAERAAELGVRRVLLSLSHTHATAIAVAILETT